MTNVAKKGLRMAGDQDEVVNLSRPSTVSTPAPSATPLDVPVETMSPIQYVLSQCKNDALASWLMDKKPADLIEEFVVASIASAHLKIGVVGIVNSSLSKGFIEHVKELVKKHGSNLSYVARMSKAVPFPLMEVIQTSAWMKEFDTERYNEYRADGMVVPGSIFDSRYRDPERCTFGLLGTLDIKGAIADADFKAARYILYQHVSFGCPALLTYQDEYSYEFVKQRGLFRNLQVFRLGGF